MHNNKTRTEFINNLNKGKFPGRHPIATDEFVANKLMFEHVQYDYDNQCYIGFDGRSTTWNGLYPVEKKDYIEEKKKYGENLNFLCNTFLDNQVSEDNNPDEKKSGFEFDD